MKPKINGFLILLIIILTNWAGRSTAATSSPDSSDWEAKVDPGVLTAAQKGPTEFLVVLKAQANLTPAADMKTKDEKGAYVFETLNHLAETTQKPLRTELDSLGVAYYPFWVANMLWVRGDTLVLRQIAQHEEIARIVSNPRVAFPDPEIENNLTQTQSTNAIEWNIDKINAPAVWALGYTGQGIVIGGQDTGYEWDHPALMDKYRGWDGSSVDHNHNWHDTVTSGGGACGANTTAPCDDHGHGTHTMGTMIGDDGGTNIIGVAPGAQWIGCRNMDVGVGTPASYAECYQWFLAPTDLNGLNPDPRLAPHVINNSWGCPESEGCIEPGVLITVVRSVRAAGIVTVHSAGNSGVDCGTVNEPAAIYAESFSVGATDRNDNITGFSSRGPVTIDSSNRLKPNISAPGSDVRSSTLNGAYISLSGTSMAAPHVAGLVALLLSANPDLIGQVDRIEDIIETTALPRTTLQNCGSILGSSIPNNTYGWGRVDAWAVLLASMNIFYFPAIYK
jgi:subtilisin family serine protease